MHEGHGQNLDQNQEVDRVQARVHLRVQEEVREVVVLQVNQAKGAVLGLEVQAVLARIKKESCFFFNFNSLYFCTFWNH